MNWITQEDSSFQRLLSVLLSADEDFLPPLSSRVDIVEYADKLSKHAINLFLVDDDKDLGHAAFYANDQVSRRAFLTSIYISEEIRGKGAADYLLEEVVRTCRNYGMLELGLSVEPENIAALKFYDRFGFQVREENKEVLMSLMIR